VKAWEIWSFHPPEWPEPHPAVIVSHPLRVANKPQVDIVMGSSQRAQREAKPNEVILDESDGLDRPTLFKCDLIYTVSKSDLNSRRGTVTAERRRKMIDTIIRSHDWAGHSS
jgi:mRNA-degrading endonuclease toxin of MazEF toxin-antitoxin module